MDGQLTFEGREVVQIKTNWNGLEFDSLPDGMERRDLANLTIGDEVLCLTRYKVEDVGHSEKTDRQGVGTKPLTRKVSMKALSKGFIVEAIDKRSALQKQSEAKAS